MALIDNLVSWYKCDESSGNLIDAHGGLTMTETSGTIDAASGKLGGARDLEAGDTEYFELADPYYHPEQTISVWTNVESFGANRALITKGSSTEWQLTYSNTSARLQYMAHDGSIRTVTANNFGAPSTGVWIHIIAWHSEASNEVGIAINDGTPNTISTFTGTLTNTTDPVRIGVRSDTTQFWDGLVDEIGIWSRVLTSGERTELYNGGNGKTYPFFQSAWARNSNAVMRT